VLGYLAIPVAVVTLVLLAVVYLFFGTGTHAEHQRWGQIVAGATGVAVAVLLDRRFRKYLSAPPDLPSDESRTETHLVYWFRAFSVGLVFIAWLTGFLLRRAGLSFLQGL
jgi:hypothetical protein